MATSTGMLLQSRNSRKAAQDVAWQEALRLSNEQKAASEEQASKLASEAYVGKKQQERTLPNVMAHAGLSGQGYTETTANNIGTAYQNAWSGIMSQKQTTQRGIDSALTTTKNNINQNKAGIDADYYDALASYYASLKTTKAGTTTEPTAPGATTQGLTDVLGDTSKMNNMEVLVNAKNTFTGKEYQKLFWGTSPGFENMIKLIDTYLRTKKTKSGAPLTSTEITKLTSDIRKYWMQQMVDQRNASVYGNNVPRTGLDNPTMTPITTPGVQTNGQKPKAKL
jgi:hypothetical protein